MADALADAMSIQPHFVVFQLFLVKCMNFCSERKITLKGFVTLTCDNQFFINFELN